MQPFEQSPEVQALIDAVYVAMTKYTRGDIIPHSEIVTILGCLPHEGSWDHVVNSARERFETEQGITVGMEFAHGYRFLTPDQQIDELKRRTLKATRQIRKGRASVAALPVENLTHHQQCRRAMMLERADETKKDLAAQARRMALLGQKQDQMPKWRPTPVDSTSPVASA